MIAATGAEGHAKTVLGMVLYCMGQKCLHRQLPDLLQLTCNSLTLR